MKELLSPAGNIESVYSAIHAGADAIYVGLKSFSARAYAENFTKEDIKEITYICHLYNVKVYVTLNTLIKDSEVTAQDEVLEIGPGAGTLTKIIAQNCKKVVSYEIDTNLKSILQNCLIFL